MKFNSLLTVVIISRQMTADLAMMTAEIKRYSKVLIIHPEHQVTDFAAVRNSALEKVTTPWTLFLDDDEVPDYSLWQSIAEHLTKYEVGNRPPGALLRRDWWLDRWLVGGDAGANLQTRLLPTRQGYFTRVVHESFVHIQNLPPTVLDGTLWHYPHDSTTDFLSSISHYLQLEGSKPGKAFNPWLGILYPVAKFAHLFFWRRGWRDGFAGLSHAVIMSIFSLGKRARIYEESFR